MILTVTLNPAIDKQYLVDALCPNEVMRVNSVSNTAGGKGLNVSRVAALAGERVAAMGFGGGHTGDQFESLLCEPQIEKCLTRVKAQTRCCINVRDQGANRSTEFLEPGEPVTQSDISRFVHDFQARLLTADVVTISGSMPAGVPEDFYADLIKMCREAGKPVILDTSGRALEVSLAAKPDWIKPNTDEIRQILKTEISSREQLIQAAKELHAAGIPNVAVSLGKDGVLVVCKEGVYFGSTPDLPVVNTVGCGDSMVAGFAVGTARGMPMEETIRFAVAVSTANALVRETGSYRAEDLEKILPQIQVEVLA